MDADKAVEDAFSTCSRTRWRPCGHSGRASRRRSTASRRARSAAAPRISACSARILPGARDAALWRNYEREFVAVKKESDEAFMEVFSKEFRKAYERQLREDGAEA